MGVKVTLYTFPEPVKFERVPLFIDISPTAKLLLSSLKVNFNTIVESLEVDPSVTSVVVEVIDIVGNV